MSKKIRYYNSTLRNLNPSQADINLTQKLIAAGKVLDILVIDHLIIGGAVYFSFADEQMI